MKYLSQAFSLFFATLILLGVLYPLFILGLASGLGEKSIGSPVIHQDKVVGFKNIGQAFRSPKYLWGRPSAVNYNSASTGGSNLGPTNPAMIQAVRDRIDSLIKYHPMLKASQIPAELLTASGSGLDPHISKKAALIQVKRIATARNLNPSLIQNLIEKYTEFAMFGLFGPDQRINVLAFNLALDRLN